MARSKGLAPLDFSVKIFPVPEQADEFGLRLLQQTYGHVAGATDFFVRMSNKQGASWDFLSSHPSPGKRVTRLQRLIKEQNYPLKERSPLPENLNQSHLISSPVEYPS
ncbi:hypothetical protein BJP34_06390 [Moorena producens PAL-8-15-08-1]|uniref:Peptidase M48 domain-containing protein n=1 Tax=Moorena producens PAL-8-15-08-1 TaxID=1458985 RepID=A0A1D8TNA3_9CYAN|nr:M48 family metalloprotease [Moorena producens]AOW99127.1 hypothetical protein BJP34_06390 [Moorena producens PAL-8-15-08-1]